MSHLGDRAAALADGQLGAAEARRAEAHLSGCRDCREAVELERLLKHRLASLRPTQPSPDFVGLLMAMGGPAGPMPPRERRLPVMGSGQSYLPPAWAPSTSPEQVGPGPSRIRTPSRIPSRSSGRVAVRARPRVAAAALAAAFFVGTGVAVGGVAAGSAGARPVPADPLEPARGSAPASLPFAGTGAVFAGTAAIWGSGLRR